MSKYGLIRSLVKEIERGEENQERRVECLESQVKNLMEAAKANEEKICQSVYNPNNRRVEMSKYSLIHNLIKEIEIEEADKYARIECLEAQVEHLLEAMEADIGEQTTKNQQE